MELAARAHRLGSTPLGALALCGLLACAKPPAPPACADADGDGYGVGDACAGADCDDGDAGVYRLTDVYTDADGDQLGAGAASAQCVGAGAPRGFALQTGDCDDTATTCTTSYAQRLKIL